MAILPDLPTDRSPSTAEKLKRRGGRSNTVVDESKDRRGKKSQGRVSSIDSYEMIKKIGEGAYGAVSKARHIDSGEIVAIKSNIQAGGAVALLREAALLAACAANPAVVRFKEVARGSDMHELYLVMEYVGRSLSDVLRSRRRRGNRFSESEARCAMAQLLSGVFTLHARGIVHRDLKPSNVLVTGSKGLKICDLGLAKFMAAPPTDEGPKGTLGYMAPEVLMSEKNCGAPVDAWALGCVMAEILAGKPLFKEEDLIEQLISIVHLLGIPDDVSLMPLGAAPPGKLRKMVPEDLLSPAGFDILQGLLQYRPEDRLTPDAALKKVWFSETAKDD